MRGRWQAAEKSCGCEEYVKRVIHKFDGFLFFCTVSGLGVGREFWVESELVIMYWFGP
jgi:hypothetical protein